MNQSYFNICALASKLKDAEYASQEEEDADTEFFDVVEAVLPESWMSYIESCLLKATKEERVSEVLTLLRLHFHLNENDA